jgi:hypothetical protein
VLKTIHIVPIYWGAVSPQVQQVEAFYAALSTSEYMASLSEYGAGGLDYISGHTITPQNTSKNLTDDQIRAELQWQIANKYIHAPSSDGATEYVVHMPPGYKVTAGSLQSCVAGGFCAYHLVSPGPAGYPRFEYAVVPDFQTDCAKGCGALSWFENMTTAESHEIVETATDPDCSTGYRDRSQCPADNEIGDLCNADQTHINGNGPLYAVQREWSNKSNACKSQDAATIYALAVDKYGFLDATQVDLGLTSGWTEAPSQPGGGLLPGGVVTTFQQGVQTLAALTVDRNGAMNVVFRDRMHPGSDWVGPIAFGDPHLVPGAVVTPFPQSATVYSGLTVDKNGAMNVAWVDTSNGKGWQGPYAFGDPHLAPGAPMAIVQPATTLTTALTVDKKGAMNVAWLDTTATNGWQGPYAFGDPHLVPGAPVAAFQQSKTVTTALTVDKNGAMNVAWVDSSNGKGWQGPYAFGDPHLTPGAQVTAFQQSANVFDVLTIDKNGYLNVAYLDTSAGGGWKGPFTVGTPGLVPGAPVTWLRQSDTVFSALSVGQSGAMRVAYIDLTTSSGWQGPFAFGDPHLAPGAPVNAFVQSPTSFAALTVDNSGTMNVVWLDLHSSGAWQGPSPIRSFNGLYSPRAPVGVASTPFD